MPRELPTADLVVHARLVVSTSCIPSTLFTRCMHCRLNQANSDDSQSYVEKVFGMSRDFVPLLARVRCLLHTACWCILIDNSIRSHHSLHGFLEFLLANRGLQKSPITWRDLQVSTILRRHVYYTIRSVAGHLRRTISPRGSEQGIRFINTLLK